MNKCFSDVSPEDIHIHSVVAMLMCILLLAMTPKVFDMIQLTVKFGINPTHRHPHISLAGGIVAGGHSSHI
jgi:hypothetical protein